MQRNYNISKGKILEADYEIQYKNTQSRRT